MRKLRETDLVIVDNELAQTVVNQIFKQKKKPGLIIHDSQFACASQSAGRVTNVNKGDSGGPVLQIFPDGQAVIYGIMSYIIDAPGFPAVYTRVSSYIKWIEEIVYLHGITRVNKLQ